MKFETKDSGERKDFKSGFRRDVNTDKPRYDLIPHEMLTRLAELYGRGAIKYGERNWQLADKNTPEEINRFKESAYRHFIQWFRGDVDEDHLSAVVFNLFAHEWINEYKEESVNNEKGVIHGKYDISEPRISSLAGTLGPDDGVRRFLQVYRNREECED